MSPPKRAASVVVASVFWLSSFPLKALANEARSPSERLIRGPEAVRLGPVSPPAAGPAAPSPSLPGLGTPAPGVPDVPEAPQAAAGPVKPSTIRDAAASFAPVLEALSPANAGGVSEDQAKKVSGLLLDSSAARAPSVCGYQPSEDNDRKSHRRLARKYYRYYVVTNIVAKWTKHREKFKEAKAAGVALPVSWPRLFFAYMRIMAESGMFYPLGFSSLKDDQVIEEARSTFRRFFRANGVGPAEKSAFEAFLTRTRDYNAGKRAKSNFRRLVRDAMLEASLMPVSKIADYFRSLYREDLSRETAAFQEESQRRTLELFRSAVLASIREEDPRAPNRVVAVVLLGSFARGAAGPSSDFDVEFFTADGKDGRIKALVRRLQRRWESLGLAKAHQLGIHMFPEPPSKGVIKRIHSEGYLVISPDKALAEALERKPGEPPLFTVERELTWRGRLGRIQEFLLVLSTILQTDLGILRPPRT